MATKYVSTTKLQYFKAKLENLFAKKTDLAKVATSGSYNDLSNKPTIPSVGNGTITITQNGASKGTFTTNQSGNTTIELTDNNTTYSVATTSANGLMSASDKLKLDGVASGASNISKRDILSWIYPVGSIYMSVNSTSPSSFIGGTWVQIKDTFLLACGSTYSNGKTGG